MKKKLLMSVMAAVFVGMTVWAAPGVLPDEFLFTKMKLTYSRESTPSVRGDSSRSVASVSGALRNRWVVFYVEYYPKISKLRNAWIDDITLTLTNNGNILLKFWLHISPEEQLRRFREREAIPWKRYKITDEDWRNRDKWPEYARAADEMFLRTSTEDAPWHVVPAENKKYARLMVLRIYRDALKRALHG